MLGISRFLFREQDKLKLANSVVQPAGILVSCQTDTVLGVHDMGAPLLEGEAGAYKRRADYIFIVQFFFVSKRHGFFGVIIKIS